MQKTKKVSKIIDKIVMTFLIVFIVVMAFLSIFFTYYRAQNKMVNIFGYSICYVVTGSMVPALQVGDAILIKDIDLQEIKVDDIITYQSTTGMTAGQYVTHRVASIGGAGENIFFRTKGDANNVIDTEIVTSDKVMGVFQKQLPFVKFLLSILSKPIIFILIVIVPLFGFLIMQLVNFIMVLKSNGKDDELNKGK